MARYGGPSRLIFCPRVGSSAAVIMHIAQCDDATTEWLRGPMSAGTYVNLTGKIDG